MDRDTVLDSLPDSYEEVTTEQGMSAVKQGTRIIEFSSSNGDTFTVYEKIRGGYIGRAIPAADDDDEAFYEINPETVAEESAWPTEAPLEAAEVAVFPLLNTGWEITYYDAEHADMRIHEMMRQ